MTTDVDFFFDALCPWAWVTSRWVVEVQQQRQYDVNWRFISLKFINEARDPNMPEDRKAALMAGLYVHRVADEVRLREGNEAVGRLYTAAGTAFHNGQRRLEINADPLAFMKEMLATAGLSEEYASEIDNDAHDAYINEETELAFSRTGRDVGTPILTFHPGQPTEGSFFGPVISTIPRGEEAVRLWDAIETIATTSDVAELKRTNRAKLVFD